MPTVTGKDGVVKIGANTIAEVRSFTINTSAATVEDTTMGDVWATHKVTLKSWQGQIACYWDPSDATGQNALSVGSDVMLKLYPSGLSPDAVEYSGTVTITSVEKQISHDGMIETTFNYLGNGPLTETTVN